MHKSTDIIACLVNKLEQTGIVCTKLPAPGGYALQHNKTVEQMNISIGSIMIDIDLTPQNPDWLPGTPTGDNEDWGWYLYGKDFEDFNSNEFSEVGILITMTELEWC